MKFKIPKRIVEMMLVDDELATSSTFTLLAVIVINVVSSFERVGSALTVVGSHSTTQARV